VVVCVYVSWRKLLLSHVSSCFLMFLSLTEPDFKDLQQLGYNKVNKCVDHLDPDNPKPTDARGSWQHRKFLISSS
jgi:hypothetical protein